MGVKIGTEIGSGFKIGAELVGGMKVGTEIIYKSGPKIGAQLGTTVRLATINAQYVVANNISGVTDSFALQLEKSGVKSEFIIVEGIWPASGRRFQTVTFANGASVRVGTQVTGATTRFVVVAATNARAQFSFASIYAVS